MVPTPQPELMETFGLSEGKQAKEPASFDTFLADVYEKFAGKTAGGLMNKTDFKCAFIYLFGVKPSKQDIQLTKDFLSASALSDGESPFIMDTDSFISIMRAFAEFMGDDADSE